MLHHSRWTWDLNSSVWIQAVVLQSLHNSVQQFMVSSLFHPARHLLNMSALASATVTFMLDSSRASSLASLPIHAPGWFFPHGSFNFIFYSHDIVLGKERITTVQIVLYGGGGCLSDRLRIQILIILAANGIQWFHAPYPGPQWSLQPATNLSSQPHLLPSSHPINK